MGGYFFDDRCTEADRRQVAYFDNFSSVHLSSSSINYDEYKGIDVIMIWSVMTSWAPPQGGVWMSMMGASIDVCTLDPLRQHCKCMARVMYVDSEFVDNIDIEIIVVSTYGFLD